MAGERDYLAFWKRVPSPQSPPLQLPTATSGADASPGPRLKDLSNNNSSSNGNGKGSRDDGLSTCPLDSALVTRKQQASNSRNKRRANISLPRDLGNGAARMPVSGPEGNNSPQPPSPKQIPALVREYCDLPEVDRQSSEQAQQIQDMTGYALAQTQTFRPVNRDEFLVNIQPTIREMENHKKIDVKETKNATNCEVRKDKRGLYEYFDDSGRQVCPEEYSRRYHAMLAAKKRRRMASQATAISQMQGDITQLTGSTSSPESKRVDHSTMDMDMSISMDESTIDEDVTPPRTDGLCKEIGIGVRVLNEDDAVDGSSSIDGETTHPLLGELPPSTDPRILMARKKLFQKFDEALSEYSTEVLKIEGKRKAESSSL